MRPPVRATYRVQLGPTFDLDDAAGIVDYLADLGVSHLYTSPLFEATAGSTHGYDITDPGKIRAELGGEPALRRLWQELADHGMGHVVDIVPNHMGIRSPTNRWWQDVLRQGRASPFAEHFDIDWSIDGPGRGRVVLPFLGAPLAELVRAGEVTVGRDGDGFAAALHHHDRWPLSESSLSRLGIDPDDDEAVDGALDALGHDPDQLLDLLDQQHWIAIPWRETAARLNWRRFFDITDLAAVSVERPHVFDDVHASLKGWLDDDPLASDVVAGVRIDHVDGLVDPQGYLDRLRALVGPDRLIVVEKILAADEACPAGWPIDGTTGYEITARIGEVLTPPGTAAELRRAYQEATGDDRSWSQVEAASRADVVTALLAPESRRAATALLDAVLAETEAPEDRAALWPAPDACLEVIRAVATALDVYRVYPGSEPEFLFPEDQARIDAAVDRARRDRPELDGDLLALTAELLSGRHGNGPEAAALRTRFAQLTAPLAAKAIEDTAFYRWGPWSWLNEVGGDPGRPGPSTADLHHHLADPRQRHSGTLVALSTHDSKRSADVRARLGRLAEVPDAFAATIVSTDRGLSLRWLLGQALVGAWPISRDRATAYAVKAAREAKVTTSWLDPDPAVEAGIVADVERLLDEPDSLDSLEALEALVARLRPAGRAASLAQVVMAMTTVGIPDLYQGDELWNLSLVDPDNRRPVDWGRLRSALEEVSGWTGTDVAERWSHTRAAPDDDGRVKTAVIHRLLKLRAGPDPVLADGTPYRSMGVTGPDAEATFAFARGNGLVVVAPRRFLTPAEATVVLPPGSWVDVLTDRATDGGRQPVVELTSALPVAVLVPQP